MNIQEVLSYTPSSTVSGPSGDNETAPKRARLDPTSSDRSQSIVRLLPDEKPSSSSSATSSDGPINEIDENALKRLILQLDRKILKNQEMRIKHADNPAKFMDSEMELFDVIREMHVVSTQPALYDTLINLNIIPALLGLLSHENTDIACAVVALIQELTDLDDVDEMDEVGDLMDALINSQITILLVNNMERLDENVKEESEGIYNSLAIIENLTDYRPELNKDVKPLIQWLLRKLKSKPIFYPNKLYASEILSILLQNSEANRSIIGTMNGIDILLHVVSYYKRHDPQTADEEEFVENLFNCLCSALLNCNRNRELFYQAEGIELMVLILKEKRRKESNTDVRVCALKLLSHCFTTGDVTKKSNDPDDGGVGELPIEASACDRFVEKLGLRVLMPIFLKPMSIIGYRHKRKQSLIDQVEEHSLSIILALLRYCQTENYRRVLNKFIENNGLKTERLVELHLKYWERLKQCDQRIRTELGPDALDNDDPEVFLRRLNEGGLFTLQLIDQIIVLICYDHQPESDLGDITRIIKGQIVKLLNIHQTATDHHRDAIKRIVKEYIAEQEIPSKRLLESLEAF